MARYVDRKQDVYDNFVDMLTTIDEDTIANILIEKDHGVNAIIKDLSISEIVKVRKDDFLEWAREELKEELKEPE